MDIEVIQSAINSPYMTQVTINAHASSWNNRAALSEYVLGSKRFRRALCDAFSWEHSPQGDNYWRVIYDDEAVPDIHDWDCNWV